MKQEPKYDITVVIPTFNRRDRLQKAVESVLQEDRVRILLHIFDNASTDGTEAFARDLMARDARVLYTRNAANVGATGNYVLALGSIATPYFVPLADDDWLLPDFLFDAYRIAEEHPRIGAAVFVTEARNDEGALLATYPLEPDQIRFGLLQPREHLEDWLRHGHYAWSSILWRTATLACVGAPYLHTGLPSDVDFQAQIFCKYPVYLSDRPGAVYTLHSNQASRGFNISHVLDWAFLFKRLDRAIGRCSIFSLDEYLPLREHAQQRYRGAWATPGAETLTARDRATAACSVGFRLGDWETAFALIDSPKPAARAAGVGNGFGVLCLPPIDKLRTGAADSSSSEGDLVLSVFGWMKHAIATLERSRQTVNALRDEKSDLQGNLEAAVAREHAVVLRAEENARRCADAEAQLVSLSTHPLIKLLKRLGMLRQLRPA